MARFPASALSDAIPPNGSIKAPRAAGCPLSAGLGTTFDCGATGRDMSAETGCVVC